jgi:hypothetical protein
MKALSISRRAALFVVSVAIVGATRVAPVAAQTVQLRVDASVSTGPITGRAFVFFARTDRREPRLQAGSNRSSEPFFGVDVSGLRPGEVATIDATTLGFPVASLKQLPAGEYLVQGMILPYSQFTRADGHTIWAHMDSWEGQRFNDAPGSLVSAVQKLRIDPATNATISLSLTKVLPPVATIADSPWVRRIKMTSKQVSAFWNHDMPLGAVVLLPKGSRPF